MEPGAEALRYERRCVLSVSGCTGIIEFYVFNNLSAFELRCMDVSPFLTRLSKKILVIVLGIARGWYFGCQLLV